MSARPDVRGPRGSWRDASKHHVAPPARADLPLGPLYPSRPLPWRRADAALAIGLLAAIVIVGNLRDMPQGFGGFLEMRLSIKNSLLIGGFAWAWPVVLSLCGLYAPGRLRTGKGEWSRLAVAGAVGCVLAMVFPLTGRSGAVTPWSALAFGIAFVPAAKLLRSTVRTIERRRGHALPRQVLLVGSGPHAALLCRQLFLDPNQSCQVIGFVDSEPHPALAGFGLERLGGIAELEHVLMHRVVDEVLIGLPVKSHYDEIRQTLAACARVGVPASYSADLFGARAAHPSAAGEVAPVMSMSAAPSSELLAVKRAMDVTGALVLIVLMAPLMLCVAAAVKLTSRGPVLFAQHRYGSSKRLFRMYKFRTMVEGAEELQDMLEGRNEATGPVFKIRDDPRVTPIGRFLRRSSLDELPQLWHVLAGEMSLVGPRPLPTRDVGRFPEPWLMRRFSVRPGLTCLWQIRGRSHVGFNQWITLDLEYIDNWSLWLDLGILLRTLPAIVRGTGAQ